MKPLRFVMCAGLGLIASGCSVSMPLSGFALDTTPTGSVDRAAAVLSERLDQEDWRRAKAALAVALDPQGNGARVNWDNPRSGAKGSFAAAAPAYTRNEKVCRRFQARVVAEQSSERDVTGSACRGSDGEWIVAEARSGKPAKS